MDERVWTGILHHSDLEGGFWELVLDEQDAMQLDARAVTIARGVELIGSYRDGDRVRARMRPAEEQIGIAMAGPRYDLVALERA